MTPTYHSIAYAGFEVANPVALDAILALLGRTGLPEGAVALDIGAGAGGVSVALAREFGLRVQAIDLLRKEGASLHSRKLRAFDEPPFR